jgi:hypothetical protein
MAQAVSLRPLAVEARVRARVSPCEICGEQSGTGSVPSSSVFRCQYHSTVAPYTYIWGQIGLLVATVKRHSLTPST